MIAAIGIKRLGIAAATLAGGVFGALVILSLLIPAETVRDSIKAEIRAVTGLDPVLRGDVVVSLFPTGTVVFDQVALGDNRGGEPAMTVEQLVVRLVDTASQITSLERQLRDLEAQSDRLEEMARNAPEVQAQFANLDRDYNIIRRNYEELLARRESVNIAEAARTGGDRVTLEVVDPPTMPTAPTSPKRLLLAAGVLLAAFGAGGALLFLLVQFDTSIYTLRELRGIGLPVLGALSAPSRGRLQRADVVLLCLCLLPLPLGLVVVAMGPLNFIARFAV